MRNGSFFLYKSQDLSCLCLGSCDRGRHSVLDHALSTSDNQGAGKSLYTVHSQCTLGTLFKLVMNIPCNAAASQNRHLYQHAFRISLPCSLPDHFYSLTTHFPARIQSIPRRPHLRVRLVLPLHFAQYFCAVPRGHVRHHLQNRQDFILDRRDDFPRLELRQRSFVRLVQRRRILEEETRSTTTFIVILFFLLEPTVIGTPSTSFQRRCYADVFVDDELSIFVDFSSRRRLLPRRVRRGSCVIPRPRFVVEWPWTGHRLRPLVVGMESTFAAICLLSLSVRRIFDARGSASFRFAR